MTYKPARLPADLCVDARVDEVMAYRRESASQVFRKIAEGIYRSHKNGETRLIEWASVIADRDACIKKGAQLSPRTGKRGRPSKAEIAEAGRPAVGTLSPGDKLSPRKRKRGPALAAE